METLNWSSRSPIGLIVMAVFLGLLGLLSLNRLPLQLFPDIKRPELQIQTGWRTASPEEVESELLEPLENVMQGLPGVEEIEGNAFVGGANLNLRFALGSDMKNALVEAIGRLNRLPPLPRDADRPQVSLGGNGDTNETLSWFFVQLLPGTPGPIENQRRFIEDTVRARLEAIPGVAAVSVNSGPADEVHIIVDLARAAALGINIPDIASRAAAANNVSGGQLSVGRRQYTLRFTGRFTPEELGALVLTWRDGRPVHLADVATIEVAPPQRTFFAYQNGNPAIGVQVFRANGANVLATLDAVKAAVAELREGPLKAHGLGIEQSFDAALFIRRAVHLLSENLIVGALLALIVVWWFMREWRVTLLIAATIPVCLCATFVALDLMGRSLNVISLAGLAFAVGMVVEGAIVVSGNVVRLREQGLPLPEATRSGARQVAGALIASTATTVAVFVPVLFLKDVEGQLFGDLALTISIAVAISIVAALTLLPQALGFALAKQPLKPSGYGQGWPRLTEWILRVTDTRAKQLAWIAGLLVGPLLMSWWLLPPLDYLPPVKRAAIDSFFEFPPGMSPESVNRELLPRLLERMAPYMAGTREPHLKNWYIQAWPGGGTIGARVVDEKRIGELESLIRDKITVGLPDTRVFTTEGELFGGIGGSARSVGIHLQSEDTAALNRVAVEGRALLEKVFPGATVLSFPNPEDAGLELHAVPDDRRIAEVGWDRATLGTIVRTVGEGAWLGEYFDGKTRLPIVLKASEGQTPEDLANAPLVTPNGLTVRLGDLVQLSTELGPPGIRRLNHRRTVTLTVDPPAALSLEKVLSRIDKQVVPQLRAHLPADGSLRLAGSADSLSQTLAAMSRVFAMALVVLLLLMTVLFRSLRDSLIVLLTVPLALVGGVMGLRLLDLVKFQALDLLSMIGFVMMIGVIINHAILLVAAVRAIQAEGASLEQGIRAGLQQRLRAILASTLTGALGALPMALNPGPGSVIYRGLAAVNIGGVVISLAFSLVLIPALMRLLQPARAHAAAAAAATAPA